MAAEKLMLDPRRPADEVLEEIKKDAETGGDGQYRLIITRQEGALGVLNTMAVFEGVTLQHLFDHIIWLPELIGDGGGMFRLKVVRGDTMTAIGGGFLSYQGPNGAQPKPFDLSIIDRPDWRGPRRLAQKTRTPEPIPSSPVSAFPPIPGGNLVPPSQVLPGQPAGGGTTPGNSAMEAFLQQQLAETRQQAMMNQLRMETQAQLQAMKQQTEQSNQAVLRALETLRAAPHPVALPPEKSTWTPEAIAGTLTAVLGGIAGIATPFLAMAQDRSKAERETAAKAAEVQARALEESNKASREAMLKVMESAQANQAVVAASNQTSAAMISQMGQTTLSLMAGIKEMSGGPAEETATIAFRELAGPVGRAIAAMMLSNAPKNAPVNTNSMANQLARELTAPPENVEPETQDLSFLQQQNTRLDRILHMLWNKIKVEVVGTEILQSFAAGDASLISAVVNANNDVRQAVAQRFGGSWFENPVNQQYWAALDAYVNAEFAKATKPPVPPAAHQMPAVDRPPANPPPAAPPVAPPNGATANGATPPTPVATPVVEPVAQEGEAEAEGGEEESGEEGGEEEEGDDPSDESPASDQTVEAVVTHPADKES